ncbi:hypothetical protein NC796_17815 [Aliifodinibius sp. S!AR15-10]|uniref:hypothetical protein n=1 Tax=Aliifodinibius sp. S!AR15-10 TaxID=2950437 RepID=UPI00285F8603|nr:hypothetical protein [Aliifodinibius sp. S!AR15-10]MDR8393018.1 hypothetical protein [Aliifodinibius sp. S!AR15-10]
MRKLYYYLRVSYLILFILLFGMVQQSLRAQPLLEESIANLYAACLFESLQDNNPFSEAANLARQAFAPGISGFIESNLAAIPLTPPSLEAEYTEQGIVSVVTGFTPIYTESSASVGKGLFLVGANASYFNLSKIRGEDLSALRFAFQQNGGGDLITANMPWDISAAVFTIHGTYGVTDRFDISFALPIVNLSIENVNTTFTVEGENTGCRYSPDGLNCEGNGNREVSPALFNFVDDAMEQETFIETLSLRTKYRFPVSASNVRLAAVMDLRLPLRPSDNMLGSGNFGTRFTFISEYNPTSSFQPYVNVGAQFWNGSSSNSVNLATGFNQQMVPGLFFSFDLLGKIDIEPDPFLAPIGGALSPDGPAPGSSLVRSSIPAINRDHTLNAGLGLQLALSPRFHAYGSALFALLDHGLQSTIAPTAGIAAHF